MTLNFDVIIVGAGIVGQSMALGLGVQGLNVALIDSNASPKLDQKLSSEVFSNRVSAISFSSQNLLERLGVWDTIERKQEYFEMEVSDQDGFGRIRFRKQELINLFPASESGSTPSLGHIIENNEINKALHKRLLELSNVRCIYQSSISELNTNEHAAFVTLHENSNSTGALNQQTLSAKLLIGADGANSKVRERFGFKHTFYDYDHTAIVCNAEIQYEHGKLAKQVFTPYGPLAFLPLPNQHQCSIVFSQQSDRALELVQMSDEEFAKVLQVTINNHYGKCTLLTPKVSFPLRMRYARNWVAPKVALIGDAAHTIHPLAGQGANLGLGDVATMLELIEQSPSKLGSMYQLRKYERSRKSEALKVIATMQGFKTLFDGNNPIKKLVRNSGLALANNASTIKSFFIKQAMG